MTESNHILQATAAPMSEHDSSQTMDGPALLSPRAWKLLRLVIPAIVVGIVSSVILLAVSAVAEFIQQIFWTNVPQALAIPSYSPVWILLMLTLTGVAVGLVVWKMPGHAGPDPATTELVEKPLKLPVLPSLLIALILMLAGGVSLGPENPIMAVNTSLVFALGSRLIPAIGASAWVGMSSAGMIAAMFGTPVAAALVLSESASGEGDLPLFDKLFAPLAAAGAGALTTAVLAPNLSFVLEVPTYRGPQLIDLLTGSIIAVVAALVGLAAVYAFPHAHRLFHRLSNPLVMATIGGVLLGILGIIGGPITLFKGLDQMKEMVADAAQYTAASFALFALVKLVALVIAGTSEFRGGRIFPSVFVGVALGLCASTFVPSIPQALAIPCGVMGILLAVTRQGWLSIFMAAIVVPDLRLLPILVIVLLPAWLVVTGRPLMIVKKNMAEAHG